MIARLVLPGGTEEWRPTRTMRWMDSRVQVTFETDAGDPVYVWLSADDVRRTIHVPVAADLVVNEPADDGAASQLEG